MGPATQQAVHSYGYQRSVHARPRGTEASRLVPEVEALNRLSVSYDDDTAYAGEQSGSPSSPNADEQNMDSTGNESSNQEKRRAQNRSAQRAFRIRKLQRVKGLEKNLVTLLSQHDNLLTSYEQQEDELKELHSRISSLQSELAQLRVAYGQDPYGGMVVPDQLEDWNFDAFLASNAGSTSDYDASFSTGFNGPGSEFKMW